jgi:hypothetical protein
LAPGEFRGHAWRDEILSGVDFPDALKQFLTFHIFEQIRFGPGAYCSINILIPIEGGQDNDSHVWIRLVMLVNGIYAA